MYSVLCGGYLAIQVSQEICVTIENKSSLTLFKNRGFKYEVQRGLKIHEIPDAGF